ncbi:MAG: class II fructose-bisphosphate aldolase [Clostridia bacterium]
MPITSLKPIMDYAKKAKIAHGAFNVNLVTQAQAVIDAHTILNSAAVLQGADAANAFMGGNADFTKGTIDDKRIGSKRIADAVRKMANETHIPVVLHLDHGKNYESCKVAIDSGYSSVMIDGSSLPLKDNIEVTREVVKYAHERGVSVEGELGVLAGVEDDVFSENSTYTNPMTVVEFVKSTGADALAISYGTKHGAVKGDNVKLRSEIVIASMENLKHENLDACLVSHGSSLVPKYIVDEINALGGKINGSGGVPMSELQRVIPSGITKINMDTDIRLAVTRNLRRWLIANPKMQQEKGLKDVWELMTKSPEQFDPRFYLVPIMNPLIKGKKIDESWFDEFIKWVNYGVMEIVTSAISQFGAVGDASKIEFKTLEQLSEEYKRKGI